MYAGRILVSAVDEAGKNQVDILEVGDIWYFPKGAAHVLQGLNFTRRLWECFLIGLGLADENEYLLAFDDGMFRWNHPELFFSPLTHLQGILKQRGKWAFLPN